MNHSTKIRISFGKIGIALFFAIIGCNLALADGLKAPYNKKELLGELIRLNDKEIPNAMGRQWIQPNNVYYGAVFDGDSTTD